MLPEDCPVGPPRWARSPKTEQQTYAYRQLRGADLVYWLGIQPRRAGRPVLLRKEVIQPQVPLRLPCYDFTPVTNHSLGGCLLAVGTPTSGAVDSHGVTGGVYKARERIHRGVLIRDY